MASIKNDEAGRYQGQDFELRLGMYHLLNAMKAHEKDENYTFEIGTQFKPAGKFDDVVLKFRKSSNDPHEYYLVQAKHGKVVDEKTPPKLTTEGLTQVKGDFSLLMYANSYLEMEDKIEFENAKISGVILATNRLLKPDTIKAMGLQKIPKNEIYIDFGSSAQLFQISSSYHSQIASKLIEILLVYRKREESVYPSLQRIDVEEKLKRFFEKFYLAVNLPSENKFQEIIKNQLVERGFSTAVVGVLFTQFQEEMSSIRKEESLKFLKYQDGIEIVNTINQKLGQLSPRLNERLSHILRSKIRFKLQALESIMSTFRDFLTDLKDRSSRLLILASEQLTEETVFQEDEDDENDVIFKSLGCYAKVDAEFVEMCPSSFKWKFFSREGEDKCLVLIQKTKGNDGQNKKARSVVFGKVCKYLKAEPKGKVLLVTNAKMATLLSEVISKFEYEKLQISNLNDHVESITNFLNSPVQLQEPKKPMRKILHFVTDKSIELNFLRFRQALQGRGAAGSSYKTEGSHFFETTTGILKRPREIVNSFRSPESHHFLVLFWDMKNDTELSLVIGQLLLVVAKNSNKRLVFVSEKQFSSQVELSLQELSTFFARNVKLSDDYQLCQKILKEYKNLEETKKSWFDNLLGRKSENVEVVKVERVKGAVDLTDESWAKILQTPVNFQGKRHLLKEFLNDSSSQQLNNVLTDKALTQLIQQEVIFIGSDPPRLSDLDSARFKPQTEISAECLNHLATNNFNYLVFHGVGPAEISSSCSSIPMKQIETLTESEISNLSKRFIILKGNHPENQFKHLCQILDKIGNQETGGTPTKREVSMTRVIYLMSKSPNGFKCTQMYSPDFYISRRFHSLTVPFDSLRDRFRRDRNMDVLSVYKPLSFIFSPATEAELVGDNRFNLEAEHQNHTYLIEGTKSYYYENEMNASEKYTQLSRDDTVPGVHWFKVELKSQLTTWHRSQGDVKELSRLYQKKFHAVDPLDEKRLVNRERRVVVLADEPGMGKSTILPKIGELIKLRDSIMWTIKIDLNQNQTLIKSYSSQIGFGVAILLDLLSNIDNSFKDPLTRSLFRHQLNKENKVWFLFDGFDEVKSEFQEAVLEFLKFIATETKAICWVTTRQHDQRRLEDKLSVPAHSFVPLTEEEPIELLCRFWWTTIKLKVEGEIQVGALEECARQCMNLFEESIEDRQKSFVSVPFRARMLAEVFQHQVLQILTSWNPILGGSKLFEFDKKFCLNDLYGKFIDIKYEIYMKEKELIGESLQPESYKIVWNSYTKWHRQLALTQLFGTDIADLTTADDDGDELSLGILLRIGLIHGTQQSTTFIHRTFAEYFVALFLDQKLRSTSLGDEMTKRWSNFILSEVLVGNWKVIRAFMNDHFLRMPCSLDKTSKVIRHWQNNIKNPQILHKPIFVVIRENLIGLLNLLLDNTHDKSTRKACVNISGHNGSTPLHEATTFGYHDIVKILVEKGAEINTKDIEGRTPIHLAVEEGYLEIVKILVEKGAEINTTDNTGHTPFHVATQWGHYKIVEILVEKEVEINTKDSDDRTLLHNAAEQGSKEIVNILIEKGAEINTKHNESLTPLHRAAEQGHQEIVKILVEKGADINAKDSGGRTPLYVAAQRGHHEIVKILVELDAEINTKNSWGLTPLHLAAERGHHEIVKILVEKGAEINRKDSCGLTPLNWAAEQGQHEIVKILVEKGAEINTKDNDGLSPLHWAAERGHHEIVKILVEKGAEVKTENSEGRTLLHNAAEQGSKEIVKILVEKGAEINIKDNDGLTPLLLAAEQGHHEIVEILVEKEAEMNTKLSSGRNAAIST